MRNVLILFLLIVSLIIWADDDIKIKQLYVENTVSAQSADYSFSFPIELNSFDNELYVVDQKGCQIHVFDADLIYMYSFGGFGNDPGRFNRPMSISYDGYDQLAVSDYNNSRIQFFDLQGQYQSEVEMIYPWKLCYHDGYLFIDSFPGIAQAGIYTLSAGQTPGLEVDLAAYFDKQHFGSVLDKYYSYCITSWGYVLSFSGRDEIKYFKPNGKPSKKKVEKMPLKYQNTLYGKPNRFGEDILVLATSNNHINSDTTSVKVDYHNLICKYDKNGKISDIYQLPDKVWLTDSWTVINNQIFVYESNEMVIYKFIID